MTVMSHHASAPSNVMVEGDVVTVVELLMQHLIMCSWHHKKSPNEIT